MSSWRYYLPECGETADDANKIPQRPYPIENAEDAAEAACRDDYYDRDGWERGEEPFAIVVISPDGVEYRFTGIHERSVEHRVYRGGSDL